MNSLPSSSSRALSSWYRVASGLRLVAGEVANRTVEAGGIAAARWAEHGTDAAASVRAAAANATAAAGPQSPWADRAGGGEGALGATKGVNGSELRGGLAPSRAAAAEEAAAARAAGGAADIRTAAKPAEEAVASSPSPSPRPPEESSTESASPAQLRATELLQKLATRGAVATNGDGTMGSDGDAIPNERVGAADTTGTAAAAAAEATAATNAGTIEGGAAAAPGGLDRRRDVDAANHPPRDRQSASPPPPPPPSPTLAEGRPVPSTRLGRAVGFASLGLGLAAGTAAEAASRLLGRAADAASSSSSSAGSEFDSPAPTYSPAASDANADRLASHLCRMRGAALKLGQMLSMQDEALLPPPLARALDRVRGHADAMPRYQLESVLEGELGEGWRSTLDGFEDLPFAAASIGQVHRARVRPGDGSGDDGRGTKVAMKVQYPGVADSIDSDLDNLTMLIKATGLAPPGLFIDEVIRVGRQELRVECDYVREATNQSRFRDLVSSDPVLSGPECLLSVPRVIPELSTGRVLTTEFAPGGTVDHVKDLDQDERNRIGRAVLRLTMRELFVWRFMQTDPNWGNFLYDVGTGTTHLIDFGAARDYDRNFVDGYVRIVKSAADGDVGTLMDVSHDMGFLTGEENGIMLEAHKMSGLTVGEPFASDGPYDFGRSGISARLSGHSSAFLQHRLTPPPEEVYTLHRKLAGAYNLCIKIGAVIPCRDLLDEVVEDYVFEDGSNFGTC